MQEIRNKIVEILKDQKEVFGEEFYEELNFEYTQHVKKTDTGSTELKPPKIALPQSFAQPTPQVSPVITNRSLKSSIQIDDVKTLEDLNNKICNCMVCPLGLGRNKFVFGEGNQNASILVIGEGPGAEEDSSGRPFVGRAGQLLTDILKAIKITREEVYIANVVKCRPPANRTPFPEEMDLCMPYLVKQISIIQPKFILLLGTTAATAMLNIKSSLGGLRGKVYDIYGAKAIVTYHPAALLRHSAWKKDCWEDVQAFQKLVIKN